MIRILTSDSGPASPSAGVAEDAAGRVLRKRKHRCAGPGLRLSGLLFPQASDSDVHLCLCVGVHACLCMS